MGAPQMTPRGQDRSTIVAAMEAPWGHDREVPCRHHASTMGASRKNHGDTTGIPRKHRGDTIEALFNRE